MFDHDIKQTGRINRDTVRKSIQQDSLQKYFFNGPGRRTQKMGGLPASPRQVVSNARGIFVAEGNPD
jgi:hypothetical protein